MCVAMLLILLYVIFPRYSSMLVLLTVGLGQLLTNYLRQIQSDLVHRPYVSFTNLKELHVFPGMNIMAGYY